MTDVVLPFDVEPLEAADLDPRPTELMMAAAGMALVNAAHAATCFPDLWPSAEASKKAFQRRRNGTNPEEELLFGECPTPPAAISYQLVGTGQKPCAAWCDQSRVSDPAAHRVKEAPYVGVDDEIHLAHVDPGGQSIQRIV